MPFEPLVLLHRLAPEAINQLIRPNQTPPAVDDPPQNDQISQNDEENDTQKPEKDIITNSSVLPLKSQQELSCSIPKINVLKSNLNDVKHETKLDTQQLQHETLSNEPKHENSTNDYGDLKIGENSYIKVSDFFNKQLIVVIDDCFNEVIKDMVSTAQHTKTRNHTNSTVATNSNNTATSTNSTVTSHDSDETVTMMASKSPLSTATPVLEEIDKETKEDVVNDPQPVTAEELSKETNDKVQYDSSGLNLRTRTISTTTVPTNLHQSTDSTETLVPSICSSSTIITPRRRGRPPLRKNLIHIENRKKLQQVAKQVDGSQICDSTSTVVKKDSAVATLERLHQKQNAQNKCNGINNYDHDQENSSTNFDSNSGDANNKRSILSSAVNKNKKHVIIDLTCKKKSIIRKRKQSDIGDVIPKKRHLVSNNLKDSSVKEKIPTEQSTSNEKPNTEIHYAFLAGHNTIKPYHSRFDSMISATCPSVSYGRTYWPANWEFSASALTGHVQKKASKDSLRKIRLLCNEETTPKLISTLSTPVKTISTLKKHQTLALQRRGSASKLTSSTSVEAPCGSKHSTSPTIVKRKKGRPPGRKNKLIQSVLKSNSPRKSPRQHASTLAAIKTLKSSKFLTQESDKLLDVDVESNKNTLDMDGPCILKIAVPNYEHVRHRRHRRQLDQHHSIIKRRRRRRSITPPPPKLCAQQPAPQRIPTNDSVDHEVVKLRTKHVDVVRRRARDERLRATFICQQLHKVQELAAKNRRNLMEDHFDDLDKNDTRIDLLQRSQEQIWSSLAAENDGEPDNMCLQIMYEQTADKRFLCTNLSDETLQLYHQQRDLALAERLTFSYYGDNAASDLGTDMISATNKRKKKRPNMTGWPKEKRRKVIANTSSIVSAIEELNGDSEVEREDAAKRRRAAAAKQQKLRRQRIKLEQQQQAKEKSKAKGVESAMPKRRQGRRPGPLKKKKPTTYRRRKTSVSSNDTTVSNNSTITTIKDKKLTVPRKRRKRIILQNKSVTPVSLTNVEPNTVVKRSCGRPKGSVGKRRRWKLQDQTSLSPEQHKENVNQPQISSGKLKCVISTRNNRMKLLPTSSSSSSTSLKKTMTGSRGKKSAVSYNLTSSCLEPLSPPVAPVGKTTRTTVKRRRLQQQQMSSNTWDVGRPKRYHSANHGRNTNSVHVEEDCCFVGSQPFEQHCPGVGGGLSHNTVLENQQDQKENTVSISGL